MKKRLNSILFNHWLAFMAGLVAMFINAFTVRSSTVTWLFAGAVLYSLPYAVFETGWEWRYLMPSYVMNFLAVAALMAGMAGFVSPNLWRRHLPGASRTKPQG